MGTTVIHRIPLKVCLIKHFAQDNEIGRKYQVSMLQLLYIKPSFSNLLIDLAIRNLIDLSIQELPL